ncbi:MAG: restriction endonuclease subunit S [Geobacteraceae bacterium]|nr:restriction endonuclease subunit S [Geobacteraceae bacterium]
MSKKWRNVPLSEICDINPRMGKTTFAEDSSYAFVPMASVGAADGSIDVSTKRPYVEVKKGFTSFQSGDVLFAKITPCMENGKMAVVPDLENNYGFGSTEFHVIRPKAGIDPKYVYYFVSCSDFRREAGHNMTGAVGQKRVPTDFLKQSLIPLPPTPEDQKRIVAEIEKQFSRLDESVASLKRIQANLKRYKAAVLKSAVEGKLTEQWRKDHPDVEPADQLLKRILAERRAKWEESVGAKVGAKQGVSASPGFGDVGNCNKSEAGESLASPLPQMKAKGIKPKDDSWKKKYKEPAGPDTANLPELPDGWVWATIDAMAFVTKLAGFEYTKYVKYDQEGDLAVLKAENAGKNGFKRTEFSRIQSSSVSNLTRSVVSAGDLLMVFVGAGTGNVARVPDDQKFFLGPNIAMISIVSSLIHAAYLELFLRSSLGNALTVGFMKAVAQPSLSMGTIRQISVVVPPIKEQQVILTEIDRRLSVTEELETTIETNLRRAERLRQTILQKAFSSRGGVSPP